MPRPTGPCAKCERAMAPDCEHLGNAWDRFCYKTLGRLPETPAEDAQIMEALRDYGLNRTLALDRDNGNKAKGQPASRIYKSRNEAANRAFAGRCNTRKGILRCMRNDSHEGDHRF